MKFNLVVAIFPNIVVNDYKSNVVINGLVTFWLISTSVSTPLWPSVGVKPNTSKVGDLESFGTLECLEFDSKAQNTSH